MLEKSELSEASEVPEQLALRPTREQHPEVPDARDADTGSSGYFSNSNSSQSASDASDPCFWKPQGLQSDSSVASATSSEFRQAEAQKAELERLLQQVPVTENGEPTSLGSVSHPVSCSPCMFFAKPSGCIRGLQCEFCHFPHQVRRPAPPKAAGGKRPGAS